MTIQIEKSIEESNKVCLIVRLWYKCKLLYIDIEHFPIEDGEYVDLSFKKPVVDTLFHTLAENKDYVYCKAGPDSLISKEDAKMFEELVEKSLGERSRCVVCEEISKTLLKCGHNLCIDCKWGMRNKELGCTCDVKCPLCREEIGENTDHVADECYCAAK